MLWDREKPVRYNGIKFKNPTSHGRELVDDLKDLKRAQKRAQKQDLKKAQKHIAKAQQLYDLALAESLAEERKQIRVGKPEHTRWVDDQHIRWDES